ncbi:hypothetical protein HI914_04487 [Erysiphe necator]|nr:hypothetical protein HI914_04487 [Erysiphe necator]
MQKFLSRTQMLVENFGISSPKYGLNFTSDTEKILATSKPTIDLFLFTLLGFLTQVKKRGCIQTDG